MKKIVHIVEALGGGVLSYLSELCNGMSDKYEIVVLYGRRGQTPDNLETYFNDNVKLIEIKNFTREVSIVKDYKAMREIKKNLNDIDPEVIHLHSSKAGAIGRMLGVNRKIKVFYTPHGYSFLMKNENWLKKNIYYLIEKLLGNMLGRRTITIACSHGEYEESKKVTRNSTFINNAINIDYLEKFYGTNSNVEDTYFTIGRIEEQKNPVLFNKIAERFPQKNFVWIGDGSLRNELKSKNITVTGWMNRQDVLKSIQPYKFFLLTSSWEGLPISLLEAMYYKKISYVTNIIGNNDTITDNYDGYLCKDEEEFHEKIGMELTESVAENIKNNSRKTIQNKYSIERMVMEYDKAYFKK